jgi:hypothetical protein
MNRRQFLSLLAAIGAIGTLSGCGTSLARLSGDDTDSQARLNEFLDLTTAHLLEANRVLVSSGQDTRIVARPYRPIPVSGTPSGRTDIDLGMDFSLERRDATAYFPPGKYDLLDESTRGGGKVFSAFLGQVLEDVARLLERFEVRLALNYYGYADGLPVRSVLVYRGELGAVNIPAWQLRLNREPAQASYRAGQHISNQDLAILRAYGAGYYVREMASRASIEHLLAEEHYHCTTTRIVGERFRSVRVELEIRQRPRRQGWGETLSDQVAIHGRYLMDSASDVMSQLDQESDRLARRLTSGH